MKQLRDSSAENAKAVAAEAKAMESADEASAGVSTPATTQSVSTPPAPAPSSARPNAFARPSPTQIANAPAATPSQQRPSFATQSPTSVPSTKASERPSFGSQAPAPSSAPQSSRPSFAPPASATLPQVRGAFVRDPSKIGSASSSSAAQSSSAGSQMNPQALFEIVCTHRKLSEQAIEAAKSQARDNPDAVMAQMRRIYDQEIAPNRIHHTSDLPSARSLHPGKVVFLLRKDDKERIRVMSQEEAVATGEIVLDGTTVENIHAAASPFICPAQLFSAPSMDAQVADQAVSQSQPEPAAHRSPKP